jgi:hypothetical protein
MVSDLRKEFKMKPAVKSVKKPLGNPNEWEPKGKNTQKSIRFRGMELGMEFEPLPKKKEPPAPKEKTRAEKGFIGEPVVTVFHPVGKYLKPAYVRYNLLKYFPYGMAESDRFSIKCTVENIGGVERRDPIEYSFQFENYKEGWKLHYDDPPKALRKPGFKVTNQGANSWYNQPRGLDHHGFVFTYKSAIEAYADVVEYISMTKKDKTAFLIACEMDTLKSLKDELDANNQAIEKFTAEVYKVMGERTLGEPIVFHGVVRDEGEPLERYYARVIEALDPVVETAKKYLNEMVYKWSQRRASLEWDEKKRKGEEYRRRHPLSTGHICDWSCV